MHVSGQPVCFSGACGIAQAKEHHRILVEAFQGAPIEIDLSRVESVDTAFLQLLVSASVTAVSRNKPFRLTGTPDAVATLFQRAGFAISPATGHIHGA